MISSGGRSLAMGMPSPDVGELAKFGYKQELDRSLGMFSSFVIGVITILLLVLNVGNQRAFFVLASGHGDLRAGCRAGPICGRRSGRWRRCRRACRPSCPPESTGAEL
jgi:hypothetical protein